MSIGSIGHVASLAAQLSTRAASGDGEPGCGTPVPGHHGPHLGGLRSQALAEVALNPQPLPPKDGGGHAQASPSFTDGEGCGNVPLKLPHWPPPPPVWGELQNAAVAGAVQR